MATHLDAAGTNFSFVNNLLEAAANSKPCPGDVLDLKYSDLEPLEGKDHLSLPPKAGEGVILAVDAASITLKSELDGKTYGVSLEGYFDYIKSSLFDTIQAEHLRRPDPDGVAFTDGLVPAELWASLRARVDHLAASEPVDYHPGSGTRVRDLVHPSLYPYIKGRSAVNGELPEPDVREVDRFGRPFEGSRYQWLPTPFRVAEDGSVQIEGYINNLDRTRHGALYDDLARLFSIALPLIEGVLGYVAATRLWYEGCDVEDESELPDDSDEVPPVEPRKVRGQELQVIPKIVEYRLGAGEVHEGVWHVEGMSHEHIVATCVVVLDRDACLEGGDLSFKRSYTLEEAGRLFWNIDQIRPKPVNDLVDQGTIPLGSVATPEGRVLVFPNSHVHRLNALRVAGGAAEGRRRVIVFWIVDPDVRIPSTREIPPQQGVIPHEEALAARLELMEERRLHKTSFNPRVVSLCEH